MTKQEQDAIGNDGTNRVSRRGNNADYLTARIVRDRPDILARMKAGEVRSVRAAAQEAGLVRPTVRVPLEAGRAARLLRKHFPPEELAALAALLHGDGADPPQPDDPPPAP